MAWGLIFFGAFIGATAAFVYNQLKTEIDKRKRVRGYLVALEAEVRECSRLANEYRGAGVASPLYRLPSLIYPQALPGLLADSALPKSEVEPLLLFYTEVETANRGLDRADSLTRQMSGVALAHFEHGDDLQPDRTPIDILDAGDDENMVQAIVLRRETTRLMAKLQRIVGELTSPTLAVVGREVPGFWQDAWLKSRRVWLVRTSQEKACQIWRSKWCKPIRESQRNLGAWFMEGPRSGEAKSLSDKAGPGDSPS